MTIQQGICTPVEAEGERAMSVGSVCVRDVDLAEPDESVQTAAQRMHSRKVGTLVVLNEDRKPIGMITDRDLTVRVLAHARDPFQTTVSDVMTRTVHAIGEEEPVEAALSVMRSASVRRVPVVDKAGQLVGLVSLDDILTLLTEEFNAIGKLLEQESPDSLARD